MWWVCGSRKEHLIPGHGLNDKYTTYRWNWREIVLFLRVLNGFECHPQPSQVRMVKTWKKWKKTNFSGLQDPKTIDLKFPPSVKTLKSKNSVGYQARRFPKKVKPPPPP